MKLRLRFLAVIAVAAGCGSSQTSGFGNGDDGSSPDIDDASDPSIGDASVNDAPIFSDTLTAIVRDFRAYAAGDPTTVADFENPPFDIDNNGNPSPGFKGSWYDKEIVAAELGVDGTPVYKRPTGTTVTTHGAAAFQKWFHDVPGSNTRIVYPLKLQPRDGGTYGYDSQVDGVPYNVPGTTGGAFFPIDDNSPYKSPFGNQGLQHNYSFTIEIHTVFTYRGGEFFEFRGDDDVFVYINKKLVINLGGIHDPESAQINIDNLGLTKGETYPLDFFSAERHIWGSNIQFSTSLALRPPPR